MELKKGYKQTEVGVIPSDWEVRPMADTGESIIGLTYSPSNVRSYGILVLRSSNIQNGRLAFEDNVFVDMELPSRVIVKEYDILICVRNGSRQLIGKCALIDSKTAGSAFGAFMSVYRSEYSQFIFNLFQSNIIQRQINQTLGATINQITNKDLARFKVCLPPTKSEQTAIATALSDADALITGLEKLIAKKLAIKQGAMQELLKPKKGWVVKRLGEICDYQNGTSLEKYFNNRDGFKVISIGNYSPDGKFIKTSTFIDTKLERIISKYILKRNDLTMILNDKTAVGSIIGRVLLIEDDNQYVFNQRTMRLIPKRDIEPSFLYYKINSSEIHNRIVTSSKPGTQIYVNTNDILKLEIAIPRTQKEQQSIALVCSDLDAELITLEIQLVKTRNIKQGMMQNLLTGKIRLI